LALLTTDRGLGELIIEDIGTETELNDGCCFGSLGSAGSFGTLGGCAGTAFCIGCLGSWCVEM
jgi:hypothetical protein